ncbi:MAG: phosphoribosyltransferase [Parvibaculum sp.]|uniref:phosphoribosyltransferase n=1 Tax=Parvibaculum sp. TaxID=2024848 RepID=UPI0027187BC0|nr:phosphoribosyltransferase [Parvibaculum sp.]MDO8840444.1 phosphoribosyltransferase [Parvibaculum sp.]
MPTMRADADGRLFQDRRDAGRRLAAALGKYANEDPVILALPRGGVPLAFEIAKAFQAELDLLFVRKIGAPGQPELGIGAVVDGLHPQLVLNERLAQLTQASDTYVNAQMARELDEIERRRKAYKKGAPPADVEGRVVIVVDDGIATGGTVKAALSGIGRSHPARLVLAVPVAPSETIEELKALADEVVCLAMPEPFRAVGLHYVDFTQTSDSEVEELLEAAKAWRNKNRQDNA